MSWTGYSPARQIAGQQHQLVEGHLGHLGRAVLVVAGCYSCGTSPPRGIRRSRSSSPPRRPAWSTESEGRPRRRQGAGTHGHGNGRAAHYQRHHDESGQPHRDILEPPGRPRGPPLRDLIPIKTAAKAAAGNRPNGQAVQPVACTSRTKVRVGYLPKQRPSSTRPAHHLASAETSSGRKTGGQVTKRRGCGRQYCTRAPTGMVHRLPSCSKTAPGAGP